MADLGLANQGIQVVVDNQRREDSHLSHSPSQVSVVNFDRSRYITQDEIDNDYLIINYNKKGQGVFHSQHIEEHLSREWDQQDPCADPLCAQSPSSHLFLNSRKSSLHNFNVKKERSTSRFSTFSNAKQDPRRTFPEVVEQSNPNQNASDPNRGRIQARSKQDRSQLCPTYPSSINDGTKRPLSNNKLKSMLKDKFIQENPNFEDIHRLKRIKDRFEIATKSTRKNLTHIDELDFHRLSTNTQTYSTYPLSTRHSRGSTRLSIAPGCRPQTPSSAPLFQFPLDPTSTNPQQLTNQAHKLRTFSSLNRSLNINVNSNYKIHEQANEAHETDSKLNDDCFNFKWKDHNKGGYGNSVHNLFACRQNICTSKQNKSNTKLDLLHVENNLQKSVVKDVNKIYARSVAENFEEHTAILRQNKKNYTNKILEYNEKRIKKLMEDKKLSILKKKEVEQKNEDSLYYQLRKYEKEQNHKEKSIKSVTRDKLITPKSGLQFYTINPKNVKSRNLDVSIVRNESEHLNESLISKHSETDFNREIIELVQDLNHQTYPVDVDCDFVETKGANDREHNCIYDDDLHVRLYDGSNTKHPHLDECKSDFDNYDDQAISIDPISKLNLSHDRMSRNSSSEEFEENAAIAETLNLLRNPLNFDNFGKIIVHTIDYLKQRDDQNQPIIDELKKLKSEHNYITNVLTHGSDKLNKALIPQSYKTLQYINRMDRIGDRDCNDEANQLAEHSVDYAVLFEKRLQSEVGRTEFVENNLEYYNYTEEPFKDYDLLKQEYLESIGRLTDLQTIGDNPTKLLNIIIKFLVNLI